MNENAYNRALEAYKELPKEERAKTDAHTYAKENYQDHLTDEERKQLGEIPYTT